MDLSAIRPVILATVGALAGIKTIWRDQPRPMMPAGGAWILLRIRPIRSYGVDSTVYPYDPTYDPTAPEYVPDNGIGQELAEVIQETRELTLSIRCESLSQSDDKTAWSYLEKVRTGFSSLASCAALRTVQTAVIKAGEVQDLTDVIDERDRSIANLDVRIRVSAMTAASRLTYIETIETEGPIT